MKSLAKVHKASLDLGLAISGLHCTFGVPVTCQRIADYCTWNPVKNCAETVSRQAVERIERIALRKCRKYLHCHKELESELRDIFKT